MASPGHELRVREQSHTHLDCVRLLAAVLKVRHAEAQTVLGTSNQHQRGALKRTGQGLQFNSEISLWPPDVTYYSYRPTQCIMLIIPNIMY